MRREKYLAIALAAVALIFVGILLWEWEEGLRLEQDLMKMKNIPVTVVTAQNIRPEFSLPAVESGFPELLSRSLFSIGRHPSVPAAKGGVAAMKKGQFTLVGVLITPQQRSAFLRDVQTNKTESVAQSGVIRGMSVGEVEPGRVLLRQGVETEELILNVLAGPRGPIPARIPAVPAPPAAPVIPASGASAAVFFNLPVAAASAPARPASATSAPQAATTPARAEPKKQQ